METARIWILGGTREARELAHAIDDAWYLAASPSDRDELMAKNTKTMSGRQTFDDMCSFIEIEGIDCIIDASPLYDDRSSQIAREVARTKKVGYMRVSAERTVAQESAHVVRDDAEAASWLSSKNDPVVVAIRKNMLAPYISRGMRERLYIICNLDSVLLSNCLEAGIDPSHIVASAPSTSKAFYTGCLKRAKAAHVVVRDEGDREQLSALTKAAQRLECEIVLVDRPSSSEGVSVSKALKLLTAHEVPIPR